ncbi:hypothetical protein Dimus_008613 [Dionaea muscipula]
MVDISCLGQNFRWQGPELASIQLTDDSCGGSPRILPPRSDRLAEEDDDHEVREADDTEDDD